MPSEASVMVDSHKTAAESRVRRRIYDDDLKLMDKKREIVCDGKLVVRRRLARVKRERK